jgi:hypothetical protein
MNESHNEKNFGIIRALLRALGLSPEAIQEIIEFIQELLGEKSKSGSALEFPYRLRDDFITPAEQSFYFVLSTAAGSRAVIMPKIKLGELFYVAGQDASHKTIYTNKIDRKHVDFVLCNAKTLKPLLGIELDDKTHQREERKARDTFVEQVFAAAKLPLVRVPARASYSVVELETLLRPYLEPAAQPAPAQSVTELPQVPRCPKCGSEMVLRIAKQGANQGQSFWGCSNYPRCRGILSYQAPTVSSQPVVTKT